MCFICKCTNQSQIQKMPLTDNSDNDEEEEEDEDYCSEYDYTDEPENMW